MECFNLLGFPEDYILPKELAMCSFYKKAGHSVSVLVIKKLAEKMMALMEERGI